MWAARIIFALKIWGVSLSSSLIEIIARGSEWRYASDRGLFDGDLKIFICLNFSNFN